MRQTYTNRTCTRFIDEMTTNQLGQAIMTLRNKKLRDTYLYRALEAMQGYRTAEYRLSLHLREEKKKQSNRQPDGQI